MIKRALAGVCATCVLLLPGSTGLRAAGPEVVLYAADAINIQGNWQRVPDPTAAGGQMMSSTDSGWSSTTTPLASPTHFFEANISATAGTGYHVWLRLRATSNIKWNESVWVQFSDATDQNGSSVYGIGTTSALLVNLENCYGCGVSGWGWQDTAYWLSQPRIVKFATTGTRKIRVQTREDGVQIDQIVLSPSIYLSSAPGRVTGDNTIVPKPTSASSTPFYGTPAPIPGTIEAEAFDNGPEGVAYHDADIGNTGAAYRQTGVDLAPATEGAYTVGWTSPGEWLNYSVSVAASGTYLLETRVASLGEGGRFHVEVGGEDVTGALTIPNTGGWQQWATVSKVVTLSGGSHVMRVVLDASAPGAAVGNLNWLRLSATQQPPSGGTTHQVPAGGDFQAALNSAQPGDTIVLQAGATYTGNFVLPAKGGSAFITIRSSAADSLLPGPTTRITPAYADRLPKIKSPNGSPALRTAAGAHHFRLLFLEFPPTYQGQGDIIELGDGSSAQNSLSEVPYELVIDRVYVYGDPVYGQRRGIALDSASTRVVNSYVANIRAVVLDSQAIGGFNGPGPFTIVNNYLEASGENIMFGGGDPAIPNLVPSDILISRNHLAKRLAWRTETKWTVKNLLELKNAQRVVVDGNILENNWVAAQSGFAVVFTVRNQAGGCPWCVVQHVQFTNNVVRNTAAGINILGRDYNYPSQETNDIVVRNNLFENVSGSQFGGSGKFLVMTEGGRNITIDHNTVLQDGWSVVGVGHPVQNFVFTNNTVPDYSWAIFGDGAAAGNATIAAYFPYSTFLGNIFAGSNPLKYPAGNHYPSSLARVGFINYVPLTGGNYRLALTSLYRRAANDGKDVGVDFDALNAAAGTAY
jgi:hypothetical protein